MHTFSKFINYAIFCFLLLFSLNSIADDLLIFKKYGYGYGESRIVTDSPFFYPLRDDEKYVFLSPGYLLDDKGNKKLQSEINMFIRLFAEQKSKKEVVMTIEFENKSHHSFYLPDIFLTFFKKINKTWHIPHHVNKTFLLLLITQDWIFWVHFVMAMMTILIQETGSRLNPGKSMLSVFI